LRPLDCAGFIVGLTVYRCAVSESTASRNSTSTIRPCLDPATGAWNRQNEPSGILGSIECPTTFATNIPGRSERPTSGSALVVPDDVALGDH